MKKILLLSALSVVFASNVFAIEWTDIWDSLSGNAQAEFDSLAKDMAVVVGGGTFHQAASLGIAGFDIGIRVPTQKTNPDNLLLKNQNADSIMMPWIQIEKGLPLKIDLLLRGYTSAGISMIGYGLKYNLVSIAMLNVSGQVMMNSISHDYVKATTNDISIVASFNIPVLKPYVGITQYSATVEPGPKALEQTPALSGFKGNASGNTIEAGINLSPFPLFYLYGGTIVSGGSGYSAGLGLKF